MAQLQQITGIVSSKRSKMMYIFKESELQKELGSVTKKYASIKATGKSDIISYAHNYQTDLSPLQ